MAERKVYELESRAKARDILDLVATLSEAEYSVITGRFTVTRLRGFWTLYQEGVNIIVEQVDKAAVEGKP